MTVRVTEAGRSGLFRTSESEVADLASALRFALLEARASGSEASPPALLPEPAPAELPAIYDASLDSWHLEDAASTLESWIERGDRAELAWGSLRVVHATSQGTVRQSKVTGLALTVRVGRDSGMGLASGSARTLAGLDAATVLAHARRRATDRVDPDPAMRHGTLVLAPEAAARVLELFASTCLQSEAFRRGSPISVSQLARTIVSPLLSLTDDATDPAGLPIPIDFEGHSKTPVLLVEDGRLISPAVDTALARAHSLAPTASAITFDEHRPAHLLLAPGRDSESELLAADEGLWVSDLESLALTEADGTRFRARARGVRRVTRGELGAAMPGFVWEADLLEVLRGVSGVGSERVRVCRDPSFYGGTVAAALRLSAVGELKTERS